MSELSKSMKKDRTKIFNQINRNSVAYQNWRNDRITYYSNRGYSPVEVAKFIDKNFSFITKKYVPPYSSKTENVRSIRRDKVFNSLNARLSVIFKPKVYEKYDR